jgi:peptidase E
MRLFLASEAKNPPSLKKLEEYIGGFAGKTIAYIPTAANGEGWGSWQDGGTWQIVRTLGASVSIIQLEDYRSSSVIPSIEGKNIVWFAGGSAGYLLYWIRRCELDKHLPRILEQSLYVGSSAGSMIAGQSMDVSEWYPNDRETGAGIFPTLQLVDCDIFPHYDESMLEYIENNYKGNKLYLLKNGEALIVEDNNVTVFGEERIITGKSF